jgi:hypothetical protein
MISRQFLGMAYRGRIYQGTWYVIGAVLHVESPHGCRSVELDDDVADPQALAELMFRQFIRGLPQVAADAHITDCRVPEPSSVAAERQRGRRGPLPGYAGSYSDR